MSLSPFLNYSIILTPPDNYDGDMCKIDPGVPIVQDAMDEDTSMTIRVTLKLIPNFELTLNNSPYCSKKYYFHLTVVLSSKEYMVSKLSVWFPGDTGPMVWSNKNEVDFFKSNKWEGSHKIDVVLAHIAPQKCLKAKPVE